MSSELVLVTGASGFIASWVVKYALDAGYRVRGTVRNPTNEEKVKYLKSLPGANERLELIALDLEKSGQAEFDKAVDGCTYVLHTASPFPKASPKDENELIVPAVNGTTTVLKAAHKSTTVKRVVVTSSTAAIGGGLENGTTRSDKDWTDLTKPEVGAYVKSKTLAEKAAWAFVEENKPSWTLTTINPCLVLGPSIGPEKTTSAEVGIRLLGNQIPLVPKIAFGIVDVRDVARAHIQALQEPAEAVNGRRFILYRDTLWMKDMSTQLAHLFGPLGYKTPSHDAPYIAMWVVSFFDPTVAGLLSSLGRVTYFDSEPSKKLLKIDYLPIEKTLGDYGHSCIYHGWVQKSPKYVPPSPKWMPGDA